ncbi:mitochondrial import receptor subunit TOM40 homolog [Acanthaster planci]|uniref:Mitochondrial import receptor subunit TOM40 homolog n=1 Tax=Acanthaster planci TaxID=133434 RepID=A0A8B7Z5S6_ACAPL|nr:mitochondrial import receptor subunit TOM40 homolog [Acanthaster planci]
MPSPPIPGMPPAPPTTAAAPIPGMPGSQQQPATTNGAAGGIPNPGSFEDLFKKVKEIFPQPIEGCKLVINKGLSNHFQISHTLSLGAFSPSSYHFGTTYVGTKQISPTEAFPVMLGDIDTSGSLNAQIIHQLANRLRGKLVVQTQQTKWAVYQGELEYRGPTYTGTVTAANINLLDNSGIVVGHYLQSLTERLALGAEVLFHYGQGQRAAVVSLAGKYSTDKWIASGTVGMTACHAAYYHKGKDVQYGVEFESNFRAQESAAAFGYQIDINQANVTMKGMVDSNWTVAAVMEKRLQPLPFTFLLSAVLNHWKSQYRFGFGLMIG